MAKIIKKMKLHGLTPMVSSPRAPDGAKSAGADWSHSSPSDARGFLRRRIKLSQAILPLIILLATFLRFYRLGEIPISLSGDEVDVAYNSYSLMKTGRDVSGQLLPITLRTIIDNKPALLAYFLMPPIRIFGLNEFGVRFLPAMIGVLSVLIFYGIIKELLGDTKTALISAFLLSVLPWHIHFSRGVFEISLAAFLVLLGLYFFFFSFKKPWAAVSAGLFLSLSLYAYHSTKIIVPAMVFGLVIIFGQEIKKWPKYLVAAAALVFLLFSFPIAVDWIKGPGATRATEVSIFGNRSLIDGIIEKRSIDNGTGRLFHNKGLAFAKTLAGNYLQSFSPQFLFLEGDPNPRHSSGEAGELYVVCLPLLIAGGMLLLQQLKNKPAKFLLFWLLITPLPSILTSDGGTHAIRLFFLLLPLVALTAIGANEALKKRKILFAIAVIFVIGEGVLYLHQYYAHWPRETWKWWQYGYKQVFTAVKENESHYDKVFINNSYEPSILWHLFYNEVDPSLAQQSYPVIKQNTQINSELRGFSIGKYWFVTPTSADWRYNHVAGFLLKNSDKKILYVASHERDTGGDVDWGIKPPDGVRVIQTIYSPTGQPIFYLLTGG